MTHVALSLLLHGGIQTMTTKNAILDLTLREQIAWKYHYDRCYDDACVLQRHDYEFADRILAIFKSALLDLIGDTNNANGSDVE